MYNTKYSMKYMGEEWHVCRANLNTHTNLSDGLLAPDLTSFLYSDDDAIAITDNGRCQDREALKDAFKTIIPAVEWTVPGPRDTKVTLLVYGVPDGFAHCPSSLDEAFSMAADVGALCYVAHPHKSGLRSRELLEIGRFDGIEIYNAEARLVGKEYSLNTWDNLIDGGMLNCRGIATDGFLHPRSFRCGWTMLCTKDDTAPSILDAMRNGRFYSSQGPVFHSISYTNRHFHADFSDAEEALLIGNTPHVPESGNMIIGRVEGFPWSGEIFEEPVREIDADLSFWTNATYVRCQIRDKLGRYAWSQPFAL